MSEYDPLFAAGDADGDSAPSDLERVRELFSAAARPYLRSPWPWAAWALLLPAAALATPAALAAGGTAAVLGLWAAIILVGGAIEAGAYLTGSRHPVAGDRRPGRGPLARWVLRTQGNTSLLAVVLSGALIWAGAPGLLPGLWLLLLGHSFYLLGGLALPAFRAYGLLYQAAGLLALVPGVPPLPVFAAAAAAGNLGMAWAVWRAHRRSEG